MAVSIDQSKKIRSAANFLREAGRGDEADVVEALAPPIRRRMPPRPPAADLIPIREAAERLGLGRNAIQRRIEQGMLDGVQDPDNGYRFVTRSTDERTLRTDESMRILAQPLLDDEKPIPHDSILGQMLRAAEQLDAEE